MIAFLKLAEFTQFKQFLSRARVSCIWLTAVVGADRQSEIEAETAAAVDWLMPPPSRPPHRTPGAPSRSHQFLLVLQVFHLCGSSLPGKGWMKHFIKRLVKYCLIFMVRLATIFYLSYSSIINTLLCVLFDRLIFLPSLGLGLSVCGLQWAICGNG